MPRQPRKSLVQASSRTVTPPGTILKWVLTPGVKVNKLLRLIRDEVLEATSGVREPIAYGSPSGYEDYFFVAKE
jgi:hypothetical protein